MSRNSGNKCVYMDCGKSARSNHDLKLHKFPKNEIIRKKWILNSGNVTLISLTPEELSRRHICENHFISNDYTNDKRQRLNKNAMPIKYEDFKHLHVTTPTNVYKKVCILSPTVVEKNSKIGSPNIYAQTPTKVSTYCDNNLCAITSTQSTPILTPNTRKFIEDSHIPTSFKPKNLFNDNEISKLKIALNEKKKQIRNKNVSLYKLRNSLKVLREGRKNKSSLLDSLYYPSVHSKTLVKMQTLRTKFSRKPFTKLEQNFSLGLFYKSPSTYKFLRNNKQITLPSLPTIRRWIGHSIH